MTRDIARDESINKIKKKLKPYLLDLKVSHSSEEVKKFYQKLYKILRDKHNINLYERKTNNLLITNGVNKSLLEYIELEEVSIIIIEINTLLYEYKLIS